MSEWFPYLSDYCFLICWETVLPKISPRLFEIPSVRRTHPACAWSSVTLQRQPRLSFIMWSCRKWGLWAQHITSKICSFQGIGTLDPPKWPLYAALRWAYPTVLHLNSIYTPPSPELHSNSIFSFVWEIPRGSSCSLQWVSKPDFVQLWWPCWLDWVGQDTPIVRRKGSLLKLYIFYKHTHAISLNSTYLKSQQWC